MGNLIRYNCQGLIYHIIPRSNNEENIFPDDECRGYFLHKLEIYSDKFDFENLCYCLMNTHPHILIEQKGEDDISNMAHSLNTSYAMYFNKRFKRRGRLFCCKYKSQLVDSDEYLLEVSRYIHNNPVKAGIVKKPEDYKWSSYRYYVGLEDYSFVNKNKILSILDPLKNRQGSSYREFVEFQGSTYLC